MDVRQSHSGSLRHFAVTLVRGAWGFCRGVRRAMHDAHVARCVDVVRDLPGRTETKGQEEGPESGTFDVEARALQGDG
jgi:hypothetical protein